MLKPGLRNEPHQDPALRVRRPGARGGRAALAAFVAGLLCSANGCKGTAPEVAASAAPGEPAGELVREPSSELSTPDSDVPDDLLVDVTVLRGRRVEGTIGVERHQARYILFADGSLHADAGRTLRADVRPGLTRQLTGREMELVWETLKAGGLDTRAAGGDPGNDTLVEAPADRIVHVVNVGFAGDTWRVLRLSSESGELPPETTRVIRLLAELAWIPDESPQRRAQAAVRYDFGPDPYAMFRRDDAVQPGDIERRPSGPRVPARIGFPFGAPR